MAHIVLGNLLNVTCAIQHDCGITLKFGNITVSMTSFPGLVPRELAAVKVQLP